MGKGITDLPWQINNMDWNVQRLEILPAGGGCASFNEDVSLETEASSATGGAPGTDSTGCVAVGVAVPIVPEEEAAVGAAVGVAVGAAGGAAKLAGVAALAGGFEGASGEAGVGAAAGAAEAAPDGVAEGASDEAGTGAAAGGSLLPSAADLGVRGVWSAAEPVDEEPAAVGSGDAPFVRKAGSSAAGGASSADLAKDAPAGVEPPVPVTGTAEEPPAPQSWRNLLGLPYLLHQNGSEMTC